MRRYHQENIPTSPIYLPWGWDSEQRLMRATHEAGHLAIWLHLFGPGSIVKVDIFRDGVYGGQAVCHASTIARATKFDRLVFGAAGMRAEVAAGLSGDVVAHGIHDLKGVYRAQAVDDAVTAVHEWKRAIDAADEIIAVQADFIDACTRALLAQDEIFGPDIDVLWSQYGNHAAARSTRSYDSGLLTRTAPDVGPRTLTIWNTSPRKMSGKIGRRSDGSWAAYNFGDVLLGVYATQADARRAVIDEDGGSRDDGGYDARRSMLDPDWRDPRPTWRSPGWHM